MQPFPVIPNTELVLAGGFVRDTVMGRPSKDRDFVAITSMSFPEFVETVNTVGKVFESREQFLTLRCLINKEPIDIAFPRAEQGTEDNRHPSIVRRVSTLEDDASRRDFTMNAMFMREDGEIIDFFEGREDISDGFIRAVGNPNERFQEDALRILRAIRFSTRFGFRIEGHTLQGMTMNASLLLNTSAERIREEINQALIFNPKMTLDFISRLELFEILEAKGLTFQTTLAKRK